MNGPTFVALAMAQVETSSSSAMESAIAPSTAAAEAAASSAAASSSSAPKMMSLKQAGPTKKCLHCCKHLPTTSFTTNPKSGGLYSKCETCRPKHAAKSHVGRKEKVAAAKAAFDPANPPATWTCGNCGVQPFAKFGINKTTGMPHAQCTVHHASMLESLAEHKKGESGKATEKRYKNGESGKAANKRYRDGEAGQAAADRFIAKRQKRRQESDAMRLDDTIMTASSKLIRGEIETSPTFVERTAFTSVKAFLDVVNASCAANGLEFDKRETWELDHKIPREAFDFDDLEDVKRCWSAANIHVMTNAANQKKSWKLEDEWIASAGEECYPAKWMGKPPTEEMKKAHAEKMMSEKAIADAEDEFDDEDDEFEGEEACEESAGSSV